MKLETITITEKNTPSQDEGQEEPCTAYGHFDNQEEFWELFNGVKKSVYVQLGVEPTETTIATLLEEAIMEWHAITESADFADDWYKEFLIRKWIQDYALALCMKTLGLINIKSQDDSNYGVMLYSSGEEEVIRLRNTITQVL